MPSLLGDDFAYPVPNAVQASGKQHPLPSYMQRGFYVHCLLIGIHCELGEKFAYLTMMYSQLICALEFLETKDGLYLICIFDS